MRSATNLPQQEPARLYTCTLITSERPRFLTKRFRLGAEGLEKQQGGLLVSGACDRVSFADAAGLAALVRALKPNQALSWGVAAVERARLVCARRLTPGAIARTRQFFDWPAGPAVLMLDYDPRPDQPALAPAELLARLYEVAPALAEAPMVVVSSASSHILNGETGESVRGAGGLRVYVLVADGRDIPRAGQALAERLWLAGHGYYRVSASGCLLERTLVDLAVWQPERLDFAAGAQCDPPLQQVRYGPEVRNNAAPPLETRRVLTDVAERDQLERIKAETAATVANEARQRKAEWRDARLQQAIAQASERLTDAQVEALREQFGRAVESAELCGDFTLRTEHGETVTVREILADRERFHDTRFHDPLEPDYDNDPRVAWANLRSGGQPYLWSHARGGRRFTLVAQSQTIEVREGEMPRMVCEADAVLREAGEVYRRDGELVRVAEGCICPVTRPWLNTHLETHARFRRTTAQGGARQMNTPSSLDDRILHNRGGWSVPELRGLLHAPTLRPDGSVLDRPGYDDATGLLVLGDHPDHWPAVPDAPSREQVRSAVARVWEPFSHYPLAGAVDRGVLLAALLTAAIRPILPTAPAFAFNATTAGSGKTKAAQAVAAISTGGDPGVTPWADTPEEQRKALMAKLLSGAPVVLIDNLASGIESAVLCAMLTADRYQDRLLGTPRQVSVSTRTLFLLTGNNIRTIGDLSRRVLTCTIDHGVERPDRLVFPFDPVQRVQERWLQLRADLLTVLRGFLAAGAPPCGAGSFGSYERWDGWVRQAVCWLQQEGLAAVELADPVDVVSTNFELDPETNKLRALITVLREIYQGDRFRTADIVHKAEDIRAWLHVARAGDRYDDVPKAQRDFLDAVNEIAAERGAVNPRMLGRWIERNAGRVVDGRHIKRVGTTGGTALWQVASVT